MTKITKIQIVFIGVLLVWGCASAHAERLVVSFEGTVTSTDITEINTGEKVVGSYSFKKSQIDERNDSSFGLYTANQLILKRGGYLFTSFDNNIAVVNNLKLQPDFPIVDAYEIVSPLRDVFGPTLSGMTPEQIDIVLADTSTSAFSNDELPINIDINKFDITSEFPTGTTGGRIAFRSSATGQVAVLNFEITKISESKVAHPSVLIENNLDLKVKNSKFQDTDFQFTLEFVENPPFDTESLVWKLKPQTLVEKSTVEDEAVIISQDLDLHIPSARLSDTDYQVILEHISIPANPDLYWELDLKSLSTLN